jgi:hypothetical protein
MEMDMEDKMRVLERFFAANLQAGLRVLDMEEAIHIGYP